MPVEVLADSTGVRYFSLAPIVRGGQWMGAAGFAIPINEDAARVLAGLTRSDVVILAGPGAIVSATTLGASRTSDVTAAIRRAADMYREPREIASGHERLLVTSMAIGTAGTAGTVAFVRAVDDELAVLPSLRRLAITFGAVSFFAALLLGIWFTTQITKPVQQLSRAARAFGAGTSDVELPRSRLDDIAVVSRAFGEMRDALAARLHELREANQSLSDHAVRLAALQNDMLQRERRDASSRMVAQLAHEVRNPVASLRNLLELIRRRTVGDALTVEYADLAIDELLRMHELAERMLDLNRPSTRPSGPTDALRVANEVAQLSTIGVGELTVQVTGDQGVMANIGPDALKQVLLNLVQNACEAMNLASVADRRVVIDVRPGASQVAITVSDSGPGIAAGILPRMFDPFVTTKERLDGVGLGLYVAESTIRAAGGTIGARNCPDGGAVFTIELPVSAPAAVA